MNPPTASVPQPVLAPDTTRRLRELNDFANKNPKEFIRIFEQVKQHDDTPALTPTQDP